jgi:transcriptional regulator with XRE-family HTH domain
MTEKEDINIEACDRVASVVKWSGLTQDEFAATINISRQFLSRMIMKTSNPGNKVLFGIMSQFSDISAEWLMRGNGAMLIQDSIQSEHKTKPPYTEIQKLNNVIQQLNIKLKEAETMRDAYRDEIMHYRQINLNVSGKGGPVPESKRSAGGLENDRKAM